MEDSDSNSRLSAEAAALRRMWFNRLLNHEQDQIIKQAFEKRFPTDVEKRKALAQLK